MIDIIHPTHFADEKSADQRRLRNHQLMTCSWLSISYTLPQSCLRWKRRSSFSTWGILDLAILLVSHLWSKKAFNSRDKEKYASDVAVISTIVTDSKRGQASPLIQVTGNLETMGKCLWYPLSPCTPQTLFLFPFYICSLEQKMKHQVGVLRTIVVSSLCYEYWCELRQLTYLRFYFFISEMRSLNQN